MNPLLPNRIYPVPVTCLRCGKLPRIVQGIDREVITFAGPLTGPLSPAAND
jgi:hypothetical protein